MENQVSIITGSRGIGLSVAEKLSKVGPVILVGRFLENLNKAKEKIKLHSNNEVVIISGDVADPLTAAKVAKTVAELGWTPQNLVLNAGISKSGATATFSLESWKEVFDSNVHGAFNFLKEFLPGFISRRSGTICLIPGTAGVKGYRNMAAYCASKHALIGLSRALAMEARGVTVTSLCPGPVDTDMTGTLVDMLSTKMTKEVAKAKIGEDNPQKRLLTSGEVATVVERICNKTLTVVSGEPVVFDTQLIQ